MRLIWIGLRPNREDPVLSMENAELSVGQGVLGDRFKPTKGSKREVTLMLSHDIEAISREIDRDLPYAIFRRNLVFESIHETLKSSKCYSLGSARLEITGPCPPCHRMRDKLGEAGFRAMRGRGGYTARVLKEGSICVDDVLIPILSGPME